MDDENFINQVLDSFEGSKEEEVGDMNANDFNEYITPQDVKDGDTLIFTNAGESVEVDYSLSKDGSDTKQVLQIEVELPNGKKKLISPNKTSRNEIIDAFGLETEDWINKAVTVSLLSQNVRGQIRKVIYLHPVKE